MAEPIRIYEKSNVYFVTNRCFQQRFFFRPSEAVNRIILGCLARQVALHKIELFAFVFMSNHFHMLLSAPFLNLSAFMRDFQSAVARELNRLHGREGKFFERRFSSEPVLDDEAFVDKLGYTLNNPCQADLVRHVADWPGMSSWDYHNTGESMQGKWLNRKELRRLRRKEPDTPEEAAYETYELELSTPPIYEGLERTQAQQKICEVVDDAARKLQEARAKRRIKCAGPEKILARHWSDRPRDPKKSIRPLCHCSCPKRKEEHKDEIFETRSAFKAAMARYRKGHSDPRFPDGTFPPGHARCVGAPPAPPTDAVA